MSKTTGNGFSADAPGVCGSSGAPPFQALDMPDLMMPVSPMDLGLFGTTFPLDGGPLQKGRDPAEESKGASSDGGATGSTGCAGSGQDKQAAGGADGGGKLDEASFAPDEAYDVVVIGAGFAGSFSAEIMSRPGRDRDNCKILLIEAGDRLIPSTSSSASQCFKLHTGMHYAGHVETALRCLEDSVSFARDFKDCLVKGRPSRRGRHFFTENSMYDYAQVESIASRLKQKYTDLVAENLKNKVFGEPEDFIRRLKKAEYPYVAESIPQPDFRDDEGQLKPDPTHVGLAYETGESQIDLNLMRARLEEQMLADSSDGKSHRNLTFSPNHTVLSMHPLSDSFGYLLRVRDNGTGRVKAIRAKGIVNCAWQNIEKLGRDLGFYVPDGRLIRVKVSLRVRLPESLRDMNTCIFAVGPHCSITNQGDGTAIVTYEPVTNAGSYEPGFLDRDSSLAHLVGQQLYPDRGVGQQLTRDILRGAAYYVPELTQAVTEQVKLGYVKMFKNPGENSSIYSKDSAIHRRTEDGIEDQGGEPYLVNSGMKMTYTQSNAAKVWSVMKRRMDRMKTVDGFLAGVHYYLVREEIDWAGNDDGEGMDRTLRHYLFYHGFKQYMLEEAKEDNLYSVENNVAKAMISEVSSKRAIHASMKSFFEVSRRTVPALARSEAPKFNPASGSGSAAEPLKAVDVCAAREKERIDRKAKLPRSLTSYLLKEHQGLFAGYRRSRVKTLTSHFGQRDRTSSSGTTQAREVVVPETILPHVKEALVS